MVDTRKHPRNETSYFWRFQLAWINRLKIYSASADVAGRKAVTDKYLKKNCAYYNIFDGLLKPGLLHC